MAKIHTKAKRKVTSKKRARNRAVRPKTFRTEESAKKYAELKGLKSYKLVRISDKKIKVVLE
ncbi:MAG: hypothetical protein KKF89_06435 [Nanoarchaeota archaeon]|nr:hypothetical protein [Nanoarchaeota archaeon]MBU1855336.1 hypothetical protein [Nanoarchaeota archaeon]